MSDAIRKYRDMVEQPWGKMFYDLIFRQLNIPNEKRVKLLDFGAGFCLTADHYAKYHDVTAIEPNEEMYELRVSDNDYKLVTQGTEYLETVSDNAFDVVICHNVLEYVDDIEAVLKQFARILKPGGFLSIIKHNDNGRAMACAVLNDNPKGALDILNKDNDESSAFGNRNVYTNEYLTEFLSDKMALKDILGLRTFFGLSSNNEIKFTDEWYQSMLELETKAAVMEDYRRIAFYNHLIFQKN